MLVQVRAPHFVAGLVMENDKCTVAAPIMKRWALGRPAQQVRDHVKKQGWTAVIVKPYQPAKA